MFVSCESEYFTITFLYEQQSYVNHGMRIHVRLSGFFLIERSKKQRCEFPHIQTYILFECHCDQ